MLTMMIVAMHGGQTPSIFIEVAMAAATQASWLELLSMNGELWFTANEMSFE